MKAAVFGLVFLFSLGATAQGGTPLPTMPVSSDAFLMAATLSGAALGILGTRRERRGGRRGSSSFRVGRR